jgi:hypothetical protein
LKNRQTKKCEKFVFENSGHSVKNRKLIVEIEENNNESVI